MSDLLRTLAFAYRRKGSDVVQGSDLRLLLAYDLRWFAPEDAKRVVHRGVELGLLRDEGEGRLRPVFDPAKVDVPLNFRPTPHVLDEEAPASFPPAPPPTPAGSSAPAAPRPADAPAPAASAPVASVPAAPAPAAPAPPPAQPAGPPPALVEAERARRGGLIDAEVAALIVARRAGEDVSAKLPEVEARLLKG